MRKRNFLLAELMIAIGLVAALAVPVVSIPSYVAKSEINELYAMERQRHADLAFLQIAKRLDTSHRWETLPRTEKTSKKQPLGQVIIDVPEFGKQTVDIDYKVWRKFEKLSEDNILYSVVACRLWFRNKENNHYDYKILVRNSEYEYTQNYNEDKAAVLENLSR